MTPKASFAVDRDRLQVTATRVFDAPREHVWKAYSDPRLLPKWWPPRGMKTTVEKMNFRVGGGWRFILEDPKGNKHEFGGEYRSIVEHQQIVQTFEMGGLPEMVETLTFEELEGGKTRVTDTFRFPSVEALETAVGRGMERGADEARDRLTRLLEGQGNRG